MKALLITRKPKRACNILNGNATIDIIKDKRTANAIKKLIAEHGKARIYVAISKGKPYLFNRIIKGESDGYYTDIVPYEIEDKYLNGKVVFMFECEKVEENANEDVKDVPRTPFLEESCLTFEELDSYVWLCGSKPFYIIHISNLTIFDKPKEIDELKKVGFKEMLDIYNEGSLGNEETWLKVKNGYSIKKAPKNFAYVEVE